MNFSKAKLVQHVGFDRLLKFCAGDRFLQNFGQHLSKRGMLGRAGLLAVAFAVDQADVDGLANQVEQVLAREFDEARAQKNVIMDVVDADGQVGRAGSRRYTAQASSGPDGRKTAQYGFRAYVCGVPWAVSGRRKSIQHSLYLRKNARRNGTRRNR